MIDDRSIHFLPAAPLVDIATPPKKNHNLSFSYLAFDNGGPVGPTSPNPPL
jgi:hypothetical protein